MRRLLVAVVLALACACGSAAADTFRVLPAGPLLPQGPMLLPSAHVPNLSGEITLPPNYTVQPAQPEVLALPQLEAIWQQAGAAYGVPWQVLGAINKVESNFGRNMGPSSAGAIGWMQFMPSTWLSWGLDANGDGFASPWDPHDAIYAAARYLAASGGQTDIRRAIFSYNHAQWYVDEVMQFAGLFKATGAVGTFQVDRLQVSLDEARGKVVRAKRALLSAQHEQERLARLERHWLARTDASALLSNRLENEKTATLVGVRAQAAGDRVAELEARLQSAEQALGRARAQTQSVPFSPAAQPLLGDPSAQAGYVFPVGGGPSVVSVGHHHHDYPAADIAAPEGQPVYALANGIVLRSWAQPDPRCGIGLTLQTDDGQTWTYCHLSFLDPQASQGAVLAAGTPVGLVGHTGAATGPHLHLQLDPPTSYPQVQPWFQRFAGIAFRWQDAPTPAPATASGGPIFAVGPPGASAANETVVRFTR